MSGKNSEQTTIDFPEVYWVFGADLSLKRPGFSRFRVDKTGGEPVITELYTDSVDNKRDHKKTHGEELDDIFYGLGAFRPQKDVPSPEPVFYVREAAILPRARSMHTARSLFGVAGVATFWLWQYKKEWHEILPKEVKGILTGNFSADKDVVADHLKLYVGDHPYRNDDESDATAVAIAWLIRQGELKSKLKLEKQSSKTKTTLQKQAKNTKKKPEKEENHGKDSKN